MLKFLQVWVLHGPQPLILRFLRLPSQPPIFRVLPTILILIHLGILFILPSGRNHVFKVSKSPAGWLTWMSTKNALGIEQFGDYDRFLVYKVYHQDNTTSNGYFPSHQTSPSLRFERWAAFSNVLLDNPNLSPKFAYQLSAHQEKVPLSVKIYSARWQWNRNNIRSSTKPYQLDARLKLNSIGTYNTFSGHWSPKKR